MSAEYLENIIPFSNGTWNRGGLEEYLIELQSSRHSRYIQNYFREYLSDSGLADMLFEILLDLDCEGSDCAMGAARIINKLSPQLLGERKDLLAKAQIKSIYAERPFTPYKSGWDIKSRIITNEDWRYRQAQILREIGFIEEAEALLKK